MWRQFMASFPWTSTRVSDRQVLGKLLDALLQAKREVTEWSPSGAVLTALEVLTSIDASVWSSKVSLELRAKIHATFLERAVMEGTIPFSPQDILSIVPPAMLVNQLAPADLRTVFVFAEKRMGFGAADSKTAAPLPEQAEPPTRHDLPRRSSTPPASVPAVPESAKTPASAIAMPAEKPDEPGWESPRAPASSSAAPAPVSTISLPTSKPSSALSRDPISTTLPPVLQPDDGASPPTMAVNQLRLNHPLVDSKKPESEPETSVTQVVLGEGDEIVSDGDVEEAPSLRGAVALKSSACRSGPAGRTFTMLIDPVSKVSHGSKGKSPSGPPPLPPMCLAIPRESPSNQTVVKEKNPPASKGLSLPTFRIASGDSLGGIFCFTNFLPRRRLHRHQNRRLRIRILRRPHLKLWMKLSCSMYLDSKRSLLRRNLRALRLRPRLVAEY